MQLILLHMTEFSFVLFCRSCQHRIGANILLFAIYPIHWFAARKLEITYAD